MAAIIDESLTATPDEVTLQAGETVELSQRVHSDLGGEPATITYTLDGRTGVFFDTPDGPAKSIEVQTQLTADVVERTDRVSLVEQGDTAMAQVEIRQTIQAETVVRDRVVIGIIDAT